MAEIRIGIVGVGNCASSLVQGIEYYRSRTAADTVGLMHYDLGDYTPGDIRPVAAFDIDRRKVGKDVAEAIFALPNCTAIFCGDVRPTGAMVRMGSVMDGYSAHLEQYPEAERFVRAGEPEPSREEVVKALKDSGTEVLINYLPVGSERATRFYAECALAAGAAFVNCIPVFIASGSKFPEKFEAARLPLIGDDIKAQIGATITHRVLARLFEQRGVKLERTYQLNTGGNTDFLNMLNRDRLSSKKISKTEAVQSVLATPLSPGNIHIGPSDYVPWQKDNKVCFIRMEGKVFGDVPMHLELRLSVEDSPNSAGVAIDAIRCAKLALDRGQGGVLHSPSSFFCKHPPRQFGDDDARRMTDEFIAGLRMC